MADKIGRNHTCPCGSGLKWKNCCGKADLIQRITPMRAKQQSKMLNQTGVMRLLWLLLNEELEITKSGNTLEGESCSVTFPLSDIEGLEKGCMINFNHNPVTDIYTVAAFKKPLIVMPGKEIIGGLE